MNKELSLYYTKTVKIMDLEARKYEFIQKLINVNEALFDKLEAVINKGMKESDRISLEQYNKELDQSIAQIKEGRTYTHQEMGERIKQWGKQ